MADNHYIYPPKLTPGDGVRVIAPSRSLSIFPEQQKQIADSRFEQLALKLSFGKHVYERDPFDSSTVRSRIDDLHEAFTDTDVQAIFTVIGGYNSNQLLRYIDWDLIRENPKIFCGFSDITALNNAILAKTGLVTYSGPHYIIFSQKQHFGFTLDHMKKCLFDTAPIEIPPSERWSDDTWYRDQDNRNLFDNEGYWPIHPGHTQGRIIGGNLCTLNLLQGTEYFPDLTDSILFIEDDAESQAHTFDRDLQSLIHQPSFSKVKGMVIGRFQQESKTDRITLNEIIESKRELDNIPIMGNADFGHTDPKITFPVGGIASMDISTDSVSLTILEH